MQNKLLCVGSIAYDSISTPFGKINKTLGGSATHFSLASCLFTKTAIVGVVGKDFKDLGLYKKHKIDISGVRKAKGNTFHWAGKYHYDLNTRDTLKTELGVFSDFKPKLNHAHRMSQFVFLANIQPKLQLEVLKQIKQPKLVGLDTMNLWIDSALRDLKSVIKKIDLLVINDSEARQLSKEHNLLKSAKLILKMMGGHTSPSLPALPTGQAGGKVGLRRAGQKTDILIIKQGEHGLLLFNSGRMFNLPGYPLENVVDPTGAGDSFAGALMGYLAKSDDFSFANIKKACAIASTVASFSVEKFGTKKLQSLKILEVQSRLKEYQNLINF